ncbi:MAG: GerMN domain-containing protein [Treponema sp.]|jgi:hypothetical protein|nr:GerMN domain-containing protein [Treponema sp.]
MTAFFKTVLRSSLTFLSSPVRRYLFFIGIIVLFAIVDFLALGLARRTFVFYNIDNGAIVIEDRMLRHSRTMSGKRSREDDIIRYTEETLLGPVSPDLLYLFPRDTRLKSLLFRDRVVYADFSISAIFPFLEGGNVLDNFRVLYDGILRNFSYVKDVRFFIEGNSVLLDLWEESREFSEI